LRQRTQAPATDRPHRGSRLGGSVAAASPAFSPTRPGHRMTCLNHRPGEPKACRSTDEPLLSLLSDDDYERLRPHLSHVVFDYRKSLYEASRPIDHVYFRSTEWRRWCSPPRRCQCGSRHHRQRRIGGLPICLGDRDAPSSVYVQVPGTALAMEAHVFRGELERSPA